MQPRSGNNRTRRRPREHPCGVMFWLLAGLASAGFVPCVMLPVWRDYQAVALSERLERQGVEALRASVERQKRTLEAIRTDPAVASRLAQRELAFVRPGETQIKVEGVLAAQTVAAGLSAEPVLPPRPVAQLIRHLPAGDYDAVFCREPTRSVIMALCGAVLVAAFALNAPVRPGGGDPGATGC